MNTEVFWLLFATLGLLVFWIQRSEARRRKAVRNFALFMLLPIGVLVFERNAWGALLLAAFWALLVNGLFWVLIGRYNPVGTSDDIKVFGLDDK